ncbi:NAD(P)-dependent dehydrogenase, short-chain alcohol dehydrogenase family [Streptomyces zhaozhouensis]|uniref:NAD(P)-dependent dehydrogenase, short-chain alcohol dehydrogenase family n=2 Tax=Streptomyces zhaozhouensis TaxID=1300267 RepID=A0A286DZ49_9ACTN|nr:NAD(P)-dependent dehydrogenase, short-chain alcohol dehydrogenase family [Streptomyces zhaozhouensis]
MSWHDRAAVVTGGGTGIGRAVAVALAERGARVLITGRRPERLAETAAAAPGITTLVADAREPDAAEATVRVAVERFGRLDALVNNAGVFAAMSLAEAAPERIDALLATNVLGPTLLTRAALGELTRNGGAVVNVSSVHGQRPSAGAAHYGASKAALDHLTRTWALELAPAGIRVNGVAPGPTESEALTASGLPDEEVAAIKRAEAAAIPLGRRGTAEEVAEWVVALADPSASWVTGQIVAVDGGLTLAGPTP